MTDSMNKPPTMNQSGKKSSAEEYAEQISPDQRSVFTAIKNMVEDREPGMPVKVATHIPRVREAVDAYIKSINDPDAITSAKEWVKDEFRLLRKSIWFTDSENAEINNFLRSLD